MPETVTVTVNPEIEKLVLNLDIGQCIDFQKDDGKWECVCVENISPFKTEIALRFIQSDG